jgi:hypothetical protein
MEASDWFQIGRSENQTVKKCFVQEAFIMRVHDQAYSLK